MCIKPSHKAYLRAPSAVASAASSTKHTRRCRNYLPNVIGCECLEKNSCPRLSQGSAYQFREHQCDQIFERSLQKNFVTKVAEIFGNFMGYFEKL